MTEKSSESKSNAKIVANKSTGYGYKYSNLADLARDGVNIPKMRVKPTDNGDYIEYFDETTNEWQLGARIVMFDSKGMNAAQTYGAALTYARRYTVQMAESVACDDDDAVEKAKPISKSAGASQAFSRASQKQIDYLKNLLQKAGKTDDEINETMARAKIVCGKEVSLWIEKAKELTEGGSNG